MNMDGLTNGYRDRQPAERKDLQAVQRPTRLGSPQSDRDDRNAGSARHAGDARAPAQPAGPGADAPLGEDAGQPTATKLRDQLVERRQIADPAPNRDLSGHPEAWTPHGMFEELCAGEESDRPAPAGRGEGQRDGIQHADVVHGEDCRALPGDAFEPGVAQTERTPVETAHRAQPDPPPD